MTVEGGGDTLTSTSEKIPSKTTTIKPKESKKDRHMKCLQELSKFLERVNEATVQDVLLLTRTTRETLETVDEDLQKFCQRIDIDSFLLDKSEAQLIVLLGELKGKISHREQVISGLEGDLDATEIKRSTTVGNELKTLVDKLIAIAYNLPDDIERLVENEAYEVNKEIITNRITHSKTIADMRITHVKLEYELIEKWEATRRKWRKLRHDQALNVYTTDITSDEYNHPSDRAQFMARYREQQDYRRLNLVSNIQRLLSLKYENITSDAVTEVQQLFQQCNEDELQAIQACYNNLTELRNNTNYLCRERVEELRKELHVYGALKIDPKFHPLAKQLDEAVANPDLAELWRLGGGLKPDFQTLSQELTCEEIVYDRVVISIREKLDVIECGFPLKAVLEEKGRLASLDKIKGLVTKLRSAPRAEIPGVVKSLLTELEEIVRFEAQLPPLFVSIIQTVSQEMKDEMVSLEKRIAASGGAGGVGDGTLASRPGTMKPGTATKAVTMAPLPSSSASVTSGTSLAKTGKTKKLDGKEATSMVMNYIDPSMLKVWNRKLAIIFYSSDLPMPLQQLCSHLNKEAKEQQECNRLVDAVIDDYSIKQLARMDRVYKKLVDRVASYLETQANVMFIQTTNIGDFYMHMAKLVELHRSQQKSLDDKAADELWDLSEDFRLQLEELEQTYKDTCQKIRESTKQDQIDQYFQEILHILEKIQQSYRDFHQQSCFAADKYPLSLINEFRSCLIACSKRMFMFPTADHPIVTEYDRIFDSTERFNKPFFEANPTNAAGIERKAFGDIRSEEQFHCSEEFISPIGVGVPEDIGGYGGKYEMIDALTDVPGHFSVESKFKEKKDEEEHHEEAATPVAGIDFSTEPPTEVPVFDAHPEIPFMKADASVLPVSPEEYEAMHFDDKEEYEIALLKGFVPLPEGTIVDPNIVLDKKAKAPPPPDNTGTVAGLSPENQEKYRATKVVVDQSKERLKSQAGADYIRQNIPKDQHQEPWVRVTEVRVEELVDLYDHIRTSVVKSLEVESFKKILTVENEMKHKKDELTDQLEDRIRNHWPRRGRVETEIKQPREAELLGHKDKTWRLIQSIQQKMVDLQEKYDTLMKQSHDSCDKYIQDIANMRNSLSGDFKNLAALQGIDVRARGTTIDFQVDCNQKLQVFQKYSTIDVETIIAFAKDFRRICPLQSAENESGYSEAELQEIEVLMQGQCKEMKEIMELWSEQIKQLSEHQEKTLKTYDEFIAKYNKCVQEVAMAEGLGQKYGAPRRRAQERIRTEISKDERRAGKVDEFLAELDFFSSEVNLLTTDTMISDNVSVSSAAQPENSNDPHSNSGDDIMVEYVVQSATTFNKLYYSWSIIKALREALINRVNFLQVVNEIGMPTPITLPDYPWLNEARVIDTFLKSVSSPFQLHKPISIADENMIPGQTASFPTIEASFNDVDKVCRSETKQLYESEGLGSALGANGVPDSLEHWLHESRDKVLGRHGYRERAWKKLWSQMERLDQIFIRFRNLSEDGREEYVKASAAGENEEEQQHQSTRHHGATSNALTKKGTTSPNRLTATIHQGITDLNIAKKVAISIQGACIQSLLHSYILLVKKDCYDQKKYFKKLLVVWEMGREKHERLLRPRLGSPDKADELKELEHLELNRSKDMSDNVMKFRSGLIRSQVEKFRFFVDDLGSLSKGFLLMLDTIIRQELLQVPPDTEIPKKHMTLKKLRKAQKIREEVAKGGSDKSQRRVWPGIVFDSKMIAAIRGSEDMIVDLGQDPKDSTGGLVESAPAAAPPADNKKAAAKKPEKNAPPPSAALNSSPSLIPDIWLEKTKENTNVEGLVSSAHRIVLEERSSAIEKFMHYLSTFLSDVRDEYTTLLKQEESWIERWKRQVEMLRNGKV